ncbi:MAG: hypothetical protein VX540_06230 [Pseudomonadota bacterium]|jgi:hypothetical protein|uniref:hypothetical protein n=1 Tax=Qipengyuania TaxID=1855416 RepID=UPI0018CBCF40|nr:hypothetical protein [Erythrobacter sp.]MEC7889615.1 hypothetical protein [Pseudomonadota bacterium]QPL40886.1 hypothetical protein IT881_06715 [Erythrobacter sp. A30-3]
MSPLSDAGERSRGPLRFAVIAAALGIVGCFAAAFTFADGPAQAGETERSTEQRPSR